MISTMTTRLLLLRLFLSSTVFTSCTCTQTTGLKEPAEGDDRYEKLLKVVEAMSDKLGNQINRLESTVYLQTEAIRRQNRDSKQIEVKLDDIHRKIMASTLPGSAADSKVENINADKKPDVEPQDSVAEAVHQFTFNWTKWSTRVAEHHVDQSTILDQLKTRLSGLSNELGALFWQEMLGDLPDNILHVIQVSVERQIEATMRPLLREELESMAESITRNDRNLTQHVLDEVQSSSSQIEAIGELIKVGQTNLEAEIKSSIQDAVSVTSSTWSLLRKLRHIADLITRNDQILTQQVLDNLGSSSSQIEAIQVGQNNLELKIESSFQDASNSTSSMESLLREKLEDIEAINQLIHAGQHTLEAKIESSLQDVWNATSSMSEFLLLGELEDIIQTARNGEQLTQWVLERLDTIELLTGLERDLDHLHNRSLQLARASKGSSEESQEDMYNQTALMVRRLNDIESQLLDWSCPHNDTDRLACRLNIVLSHVYTDTDDITSRLFTLEAMMKKHSTKTAKDQIRGAIAQLTGVCEEITISNFKDAFGDDDYLNGVYRLIGDWCVADGYGGARPVY